MASETPHPRTGYRKADAKRATLCVRLTDEAKALLIDQAAAAGCSVAEHIARLARAEKSRSKA